MALLVVLVEVVVEMVAQELEVQEILVVTARQRETMVEYQVLELALEVVVLVPLVVMYLHQVQTGLVEMEQHLQ